MLRKFIHWNQRVSQQFDNTFVPESWRIDGLQDYVHNVVPPLVKKNSRICDVGGGKRPFVGSEMPKSNQYIVGIDIDKDELRAAPKGIYNRTVVSDIGSSNLMLKNVDASLVICEAVLEHVQNNTQAVSNITQLARKNGTIALFIPSRFALFAVINRWLPEKVKRKLLFSIFPETEHAQGFPAYYDHCTPKDVRKLLEASDVEIEELRCYYQSTYFSFFLPAHILWRLYQLVAFGVLRQNAAESFSIVGIKK